MQRTSNQDQARQLGLTALLDEALVAETDAACHHLAAVLRSLSR